MDELKKALEKVLLEQYARILTQVCRDRHSPAYGCFDRNWWHYKIRDYPSIILQQGGYFCALLSRMELFRDISRQLRETAEASVCFWHTRACRRGAFEEYYPWEKGYPPLAFSTLAALKTISMLDLDIHLFSRGIKKAASQLLSRREYQAANQQVAGLAALTRIRSPFPELVPEDRYREVMAFTLGLQDPEGWFTEYDGSDLGYLSVTLDCLWDIWDLTHDEEIRIAGRSALGFMHKLVSAAGGNIGLLNSRDTDYLVPYGIVRYMGCEDPIAAAEAAEIMSKAFSGEGHPFARAVDDRYWVHYIGHSFARAYQFLCQNTPRTIAEPTSPVIPPFTGFSLPNAGFTIRRAAEITFLFAARKGGAWVIYGAPGTGHYCSDFGWMVEHGKKQYVTNWESGLWKSEAEGETVTVSGYLFPHRGQLSTPLKHFLLRFVSYFLGYQIIGFLKNVLIFKKRRSRIFFTRQVSFSGRTLQMDDCLQHLPRDARVIRATRSSKRHVASADSYHPEDFHLCKGFHSEQTKEHEQHTCRYKTTITLP